MRARTIFVIFLAAAFALGAVTCGLAQSKKPLKIGAVFSVTGPAAFLGDPEKKTVLMMQKQINAAGGVNGFPIEVIVEDDEGKEPKTVAAVEKLINKDMVLAVIGPSRSGNSMAIKEIMQKAEVPNVSAAAAQVIVDPLYAYVFKVPQLDNHVVIRILEQMKKMGIKKIGLITATEAFGKEGRKQVQKYSKEMGFEVVADETYGPADTDMTAQLKKIDEAGAQAVINWSIVPAQSIVPKNMKQLGMKIPLFQSHGFGNPKYIEAAGDAAVGIIFPAGPILVADRLPDSHWQKKVLMAYKTAYEKEYGPPVSTFGGHAYDALGVVLNAIKMKKVTPDMDLKQARKLIRDGIEETKGWVGIHGEFNYSPKDHTGLDKDKSLDILVVEPGGKIGLLKK